MPTTPRRPFDDGPGRTELSRAGPGLVRPGWAEAGPGLGLAGLAEAGRTATARAGVARRRTPRHTCRTP